MSANSPQYIVDGALKAIGGLASGESATGNLANEAFDMLNDMLDVWSNEKMMVHYVTEIIFPLTSGVYQYTIGPGGSIGAAFTGSIAGNILTVTAIASGAITLGQTLSGAGIAAGTTISGFISGAGETGIGTYRMSGNQTAASTAITAYYQRPLRINSSFVRINSQNAGLDYPVRVINVEDYELIGQKSMNGAWPRALYYQPSVPLGNINVWPNPNQGEMHLFADTVLGNFSTLQDVVNLPQGYKMAMRWGLAELMMPQFGKSASAQIEMVHTNAAAGRAWIKRTNMQPPPQSQFDAVLTTQRKNDAGWILNGGFSY